MVEPSRIDTELDSFRGADGAGSASSAIRGSFGGMAILPLALMVLVAVIAIDVLNRTDVLVVDDVAGNRATAEAPAAAADPYRGQLARDGRMLVDTAALEAIRARLAAAVERERTDMMNTAVAP